MPSVTIKLSDELHAGLKAKAAREERSMAQVIQRTLRESVEEPPVVGYLEAKFKNGPPWAPQIPVPVVVDAQVPPEEIFLTDQVQTETKAEPCKHPITRRIGRDCGACGKTEVWK